MSTTKVKAHKVRATLRDRKRCYNGHPLNEENVDHYGKGGYRKSENTRKEQIRWLGCRRCRKDARTRWRIKNAAKLVAARRAARKADKEALAGAFAPKANGRKAAPKADRKVAPKGRKPKLTGQARIDAGVKAMFSHKDAGKGRVKAA